MPQRIQLSRAAGWRLPAGAVSVAAPTKWGNPFRPGERSIDANTRAVGAYRDYLRHRPDLVESARTVLVG